MIIKNLNRILSQRLDEKIVDKGMQLCGVLANLEGMATNPIDRSDLSDVQGKIKSAMALFQEAHEDLYALRERLATEQDAGDTEQEVQ
jgi:hypothetical protein